MAIYLRNSSNVKPRIWGSPADIQYAVSKNAEKIYGINPDNIVLAMPMWEGAGDRMRNYTRIQNDGIFVGDCGFTHDAFRYINPSFADPVALADTLKNDASDVSVITTINTLGAVDGNRIYIGRGRDYAGAGWNIQLTLNSSLYPLFIVVLTYPSTAGYAALSSNPINANIYYNYVGTLKQNNSLDLYVNGLNVASTSLAGKTNLRTSTVFWGIGGFSGETVPGVEAHGYFKGLIIADIGITAAQVALFNDLPWGLYEPVSRPVYYFQSAAPPTGGAQHLMLMGIG